MIIQHNIMAQSSYRNFVGNNNKLKKNMEKLSSGYKINRAGDDAAGLAISEKMRAQITGLDAAQKNVQDGISLVQTAEGAMQEIQDMLGRMTYLATQSANGTYDDEIDRANLQKEVGALSTEIDRIAESANFNGINLLDGSLDADGKLLLETVAKTVGIEGYDGLGKDVLLPPLGTVQGTNTVLRAGAAVEKTVFSVDLGTVTFDNAPGNTFELNVGGTKFTIDGGVTTGGTAAKKAVYETSALAAPLEGEKTYNLAICGKAYDVKGETAAEQATDWVSQYQNDPYNLLYDVAYVGGKIQYTQRSGGTDSPPGSTIITPGQRLVKSTGTITVTTPTVNGDTITIDGQLYRSSGNGRWTYIPLGSSDPAKYKLEGGTGTTPNITVTGETGKNGNISFVTNGTIVAASSTVTMANGMEEVKGKFESGVITRETVPVSVDPALMEYDGHSVSVASNLTVREQLEAFAASYNANGAKEYTAALGDGGDTLVFTAKQAGAVGDSGPSAAPSGTGITQVIAGEEATGGSVSGPLNAAGIAAMIASSDSDVTVTPPANLDGTVTMGGTTYEMSSSGSRITFTQVTGDTGNDRGAKNVSVNVGSDGVAGTYDDRTTVISQRGDVDDERIASTVIKLTSALTEEYAYITIGEETYSFTGDKDLAAKDGYVDVSSGDLRTIAKNLAAAAAENATFEVSVTQNGELLLVERDGQSAFDFRQAAGFTEAIGFGNSIMENGEALVLQIGDTGEIFNRLGINVDDMHVEALGIGEINVGTQQGAQSAIEKIKNAVNSVSATRGTLGAVQNRLEHTANNLSIMEENIQNAESGVRDTDMAEEMMAYTKNNILLQSSQAMLAQANTVPQGVLQLLA